MQLHMDCMRPDFTPRLQLVPFDAGLHALFMMSSWSCRPYSLHVSDMLFAYFVRWRVTWVLQLQMNMCAQGCGNAWDATMLNFCR